MLVGLPSPGPGRASMRGARRTESPVVGSSGRDGRTVAGMNLDHGIHVIDTGFVRPHLDAAYLIVERGRGAFIDCGVNHSVPHLLAALAQAGLTPGDVDWLILTHVHLDHAGGAGELLRRLPNAKLVVHPRGVRHMVDPTALMAGASAVYGEDVVRRTYGTLTPVPPGRIVEATEGLELVLGSRRLTVFDTPGHARHHVCYRDHGASAFFTGDTFGISYREFDTARGAFIFPTSTPVQFEPEAMKASIARMAACQPEAMYLTHYSRVTDVARLAAELIEQVDQLVALAQAADGHADRHERLVESLHALFAARAAAHGCTLGAAQVRELLALDAELNAQGLEVWLDRARAA